MASNYSKYSNVRVYRRYCFGAIFSGLLGLCVAGAMAVLLLFPLIYFQYDGGEPFYVTGLQFFMYALRGIPFLKFDNLPDLLNYDKFLIFNDYINAYNGTNQMLSIIKTIYPFVEYGLDAFFVIAIIFAVVVGILGLVFVLAGRNHNPKMCYNFTKTVFVFTLLFLALTFVYFFFTYEIIKAVVADGAPEVTLFAVYGISLDPFSFIKLPYPLLVLGGLLILMIMLGVTYNVQFKNRVFAGRKKSSKDVPPVENNVEPNGQPQQNMSYQQMSYQQPYGNGMMNEPAPMKPAGQMGPMTLPIGLKEIGDHAYAKCLTLKDATIPAGITDLGPSAFSNCLNLETVTIPMTIKEIGYNCFFNTPNLKKITYQGRVQDWKRIVKGSNWLTHSGTNIVDAVDGKIAVNTQ